MRRPDFSISTKICERKKLKTWEANPRDEKLIHNFIITKNWPKFILAIEENINFDSSSLSLNGDRKKNVR